MITHPQRWWRSFYWRIGVSFVVLVVVVLIAQGIMFSFMMERSNLQDPEHSPNNVAARIAADISATLEYRPDLNIGDHLRSRYARAPWPAFVVMRDGRVAASANDPLPDEIRRSADAILAGVAFPSGGDQPRLSGPIVSAPIQVGNELRGLVLLPPPPPRSIVREVGHLLSLPGIALLVVATVIAAAVLFAPARRRLAALESAAEDFGSGDLAVRAPEDGGDEIARVARAFNRMANELAARDRALRASDRLRRQMLADVSHELKTPLTAMRGYLETLQMPDVATDPDTRQRYFATVVNETRRLERIVLDLLDLARFENGVATLETRVFAIGRLFEHVVRRYERDASARNVTMWSIVDETSDQLVADPHRIEQVIDNLVANALRFTPAGGSIELRASMEAHAMRLEVIDSGQGIEQEHVEHIFDRFYKVDAARAASSAGSGLGLSIVQAIVEQHGGTIVVSSMPGRTRFSILLPQPTLDPTSGVPADPGAGASTHPIH